MVKRENIQETTQINFAIHLFYLTKNQKLIYDNTFSSVGEVVNNIFLKDFKDHKPNIEFYALCLNKSDANNFDAIAWYSTKSGIWTFKPSCKNDSLELKQIRNLHNTLKKNDKKLNSFSELKKFEEEFDDKEPTDTELAEIEEELRCTINSMVEDDSEDDDFEDIFEEFSNIFCLDYNISKEDFKRLAEFCGMLENNMLDSDKIELDASKYYDILLDLFHESLSELINKSKTNNFSLDDTLDILSDFIKNYCNNKDVTSDKQLNINVLKFALTNLLITSILYKLRLNSFCVSHK